MRHSRRVQRVRLRLRTGVLHVDGENLDRVNAALLREAGYVPAPAHRPSWHLVRHHLERRTGVSWQGCFWLPDFPGADTPERDGFIGYLDRTCRYEVRLVDIPSAAGYARADAVDEAIEAETHRMLAAPDCPDAIGVATCDGGFLRALEAVARAGRRPVLATFRGRCSARLLATAHARGWDVHDLSADLHAFAERALGAEAAAVHRAAARPGPEAAPRAGPPLERALRRAVRRLAGEDPGRSLGARVRLTLRRGAGA